MQKVRHQHLEICIKLAIGMCVSATIQPIVTPWYVIDGHMTTFNAWRMTILFTCVSYLIQLPLRKIFNAITRREFHRTGQQMTAAPSSGQQNSNASDVVPCQVPSNISVKIYRDLGEVKVSQYLQIEAFEHEDDGSTTIRINADQCGAILTPSGMGKSPFQSVRK